MGLKERLVLITKELKLSGRAFEKECGLTNGAFAGFGDRIGADILNKIIIRYPQFSARWILTGEGEMLAKNDGNCVLTTTFLEKISSSFEKSNEGMLAIIGQNGEVIKINADIIKQNSELIRQHAEAMAVIQKLSEKLL